MSNAAAKAIVQRYYEALNAGDLDALDPLVTPGYQYHTPGLPPGLSTFKHMLRAYRASFPDLHHTVEQLIAEDDRVVALVTTRGTHLAPFLGHPPTQRPFAAEGVDIFRLEGERLAERWGTFDTLSMLQQLGLYRPVTGVRV